MAFEREERYVVTKIKTGKQVDCVVVEADWPEYETVWNFLQCRIDGMPNVLEITQAENASLKEQVVTLEKLQGVALIESLRAEVAERQEDHMKLVEENHELRQQLAASQLEAKRLREALTAMVAYAREDGCGLKVADEALSSPASTEALDAYVAEKVKEASATQKEYYESVFNDGGKQISKANRQRDLAVSAYYLKEI